MADFRLKELRGRQRRRFLKMMGVAAAGIGLEKSKLLDYLAGVGGNGLAEAATGSGLRCLAVTGGNGSFAWFQQLWPFPDIVLTGQMQATFGATASYLYTTGHGYAQSYKGTHWTGGDRPFFYGPDAPWFNHAQGTPIRPVTGIIAGNDETHTEFPESAALVSGSSSLLATIGAIQAQHGSALVPVIGIDPLKYGEANGAPDVVTVPSADGMVDLFNSAASQLTLAAPDNQALFETYYKALVGLRRASSRSSWQPQLEITKGAARLIGVNLAAALTPTGQDLIDYGIADMLQSTTLMTAQQKRGLENFGRTLITTARAFKLGLSSSAIVGMSPGPTSETTFTDPHTTGDTATTKNMGRTTTMHLGRILDGFYADLAKAEDPDQPGKTLDQTTVFLAYGDTPHTPLKLDAWPDATPEDSNWLYVMGQGHLKDGWFGQVHANGDVSGFDPTSGQDVLGQPATQTSTAAGAAAAYAVAKGDMNTVSQYYVGPPITGMVT